MCIDILALQRKLFGQKQKNTLDHKGEYRLLDNSFRNIRREKLLHWNSNDRNNAQSLTTIRMISGLIG